MPHFPSLSMLSTTPLSFSDSSISIPLGILIGLFASFIQSLGLTIQRKSHILNQDLPKPQQRLEYRRPLWLLGFATFITSNLIGSLVQIASLPVVILAPLGAVSLLWNAFFARLILGDVFSLWMVLGTILIAVGSVLIAIFGIVPEPTRALEDLLELFRRPAFVAYFSILGSVVVVCLALTHIGEFSWSRRLNSTLELEAPLLPAGSTCNRNETDIIYTAGTASEDSTITEATPLLDRKQTKHGPLSNSKLPPLDSMDRTRILLSISYASASGILSGMCLIFAKSGVELLLLTFGGRNQFRRWESWALLSALVVFALLQMWYLHKALILADPTLVCPSAFCFYNLSSIVNGLVYFNQLQLIEAAHLLLVTLGIAVLLGGVWVVSVQSGGGGVDLGTWSPEDFTEDDAALHVAQSESEVIDYNAAVLEETYSEATINSITNLEETFSSPRLRSTRSEPLQALSASSSRTLGRELPRVEIPQFPRHRHTMYPTNALASPPMFRLRFHRRTSTLEGDSHYSSSSHQRPGSHPSGTFAPPFNTVSALGAGLQIGISAVSPGFSIVPRERRRKTSGPGLGIAEVEANWRERAASREGNGGNFEHTNGDGEISNIGASPSSGEAASSLGAGDRRRQRWKWLKDLLL